MQNIIIFATNLFESMNDGLLNNQPFCQDPLRKYSRTFVQITTIFCKKIQINLIFIAKSLCISNICCTFVANLVTCARTLWMYVRLYR